MIVRSKVKGTYNMPEGATLDLGAWELEVEGLLDDASFMYGHICAASFIAPGLWLSTYTNPRPCSSCRAGRCFTETATVTTANPSQGQVPGGQRQGLWKRPRSGPNNVDGSTKEASSKALHDPSATDALILNRYGDCKQLLA